MCSVFVYILRTTIVLQCVIQLTRSAWLRCYKGSLDHYSVTPLENPMPMMNSTCIDPTLPTVVYTFGYRGRVAGPATTAVLTAYIAKRKRNVIVLDWEEEARSGLFGIPLGYALSAVPNAKKIGNQLGEALTTLAGAGVNMTQIHLLGHSLGAHIMAYAGRRSRENGHVVSRITGLDPARALFEGTFALQSGIDRTCAKFVDIIHSDPGGYGTSVATGTVDIWPNYAGSGGTQPGCLNGDFDMFSPEDEEDYADNFTYKASIQRLNRLRYIQRAKRPYLCNHDRSWRYYVEAISSPTAFPAAAAEDFDNWVAKEGEEPHTVYLGDLTSTRARGNYYLTTNAKPLFGKGKEGLRPDDNQTRRRRNSLTRLLKYLR